MPTAIITDIPDDDSASDSSVVFELNRGHPCQANYVTEESACPLRDTDACTSLRAQRESEGRCGNCGIQTYETRVDSITGMVVKVALTIEGEVHRGRCLFCYPIFSHQVLRYQLVCQQATGLVRPETSCNFFIHSSSFTKPLNLSVERSTSQNPLFQMSSSVHNPSDPLVHEALTVIQGSSFDIVDVLSAMSRLWHDVVVQERGCERLWILSWDEDNSAAIGHVGGIPIILKAMFHFPDNIHLQQCACESLQNLALIDSNRREICDLSGVHLIIKGMSRHSNVPGIQQSGCTALASIASSSNFRRRLVEEAGGLNAILNAVRNAASGDSVSAAASDALRAMGLNPDGRVTPTPCGMEDGEVATSSS